MEHLLLILLGLSLLACAILGARLAHFRRCTREITQAFRDRLTEDTNTLIDVSTSDPCLRKLASEINVQLRQLRKERHRFQQGDRELKEAVTNISHDLRTPLTAISGYLDLLEREEHSEKTERYLASIRNRTEALKGLTEELFRYSVVTSSQELKPERLDVVSVLEESLLSFLATLEQRGIQPQISLPESPLWRELDPGALNRVFSNILSNALKYAHGDLTVTMTEGGRITFSNHAPGLNALTVARLFDRFYTVEMGRNSTGLGLSIARILTERMGGRLEALYENGVLSIQLTLPE